MQESPTGPYWPSNFAASEPHRPLPAADPQSFVQVFDAFGITWYGWPLDNRWAVVMDGECHLRAVPLSERQLLPGSLQLDLNASAVAGLPRALDCERLFLFAVEYAEELADVPGVNDPVALRGRLYGPFSTDAARPLHASSVGGRLCVSRACVLEGLLRGEPFVFHGAAGRTRHMMLPAGTIDERAGEAVLAYPAFVEMRQAADNTSLAAGLAYDLLARLQDELRRAGVRGAFPELRLPVASRHRHAARLSSQGLEVRGRFAYRSRNWIGRLFEGVTRRREELPPEGSFADFLRIAELALENLPGWPTAQAAAAHRLSRVLEASWPAAGPFGLKRIGNEDGGTLRDGVIEMRCGTEKGCNAVFRVPPELYLHGGAWSVPIDVDVEHFDGSGGGQICYVPGWHEQYKIHESFVLTGTQTWRTASYRVGNARIDGRLWGGDVGVYFHHPSRPTFRLRRVTVRATRPPWLDPELQECTGHLDVFGEPGRNGTVVSLSKRDADALPFSAWVVNVRRRTAEGIPTLVLRSAEGFWQFHPESRSERPDIVSQFGGAYAKAGFHGVARLQELPSGTYRVVLRLQEAQDGPFVEHDTGTTLRLSDGPEG